MMDTNGLVGAVRKWLELKRQTEEAYEEIPKTFLKREWTGENWIITCPKCGTLYASSNDYNFVFRQHNITFCCGGMIV